MGFEIDINDSIDGALSEENFDVLAFVKGSAAPVEEVVIYTDADAALRTARILIAEEERKERTKTVDEYSLADEPEFEAELLSEEELTELHDRLVASGLTFKVRGLAPAALKALENSLKAKNEYTEGDDNEAYNDALELELTARSIVEVTNTKGGVNRDKWSVEKAKALFENLYPSEREKLLAHVAQVNYVAAIFDRAVSADFS